MKKISTLLAAVAVIAFAVPTAASANTPTLWDHNGRVAVNAKVVTTTTNASWLTAVGLQKCTHLAITLRVGANSGGVIKWIGVGPGITTGCTVGGEPITVSDITVNEIHTSVSGSGTVNFTFKSTLPGGINCHFESSGVPFTYTAGVTNVNMQITNGNMVGTPALCEPGLISATLKTETELPGSGVIWIQ